jgi:hypothetical protein
VLARHEWVPTGRREVVTYRCGGEDFWIVWAHVRCARCGSAGFRRGLSAVTYTWEQPTPGSSPAAGVPVPRPRPATFDDAFDLPAPAGAEGLARAVREWAPVDFLARFRASGWE